MLTRPLHRSVCEPVSSELTAARSFGSAQSLTWDADSTALGAAVLSNGDLTGSITTDDPNGAVTLPSAITSGKVVAKVTLTYPGAAALGECIAYLQAGDTEGSGGSFAFYCDGTAYHDPDNPDLSRPVPSGSSLRLWINQTTGKLWMGNDASGPAGDPEAGTSPAFTFTPGTPLWLRVNIYSSTGGVTSATLVPDYTSGTYVAPTP